MKRTNKIFTVALIVFLFIGVFFFFNHIISARAEIKDTDEVIIEGFETDSVIITLTREETLKFKDYSEKDFEEIGCIYVEDLTQYTVDYVYKKINGKEVEKPMLVDVDNFKRILRLELREKTKENVLQAIEKLSKKEDVLYVGPNYIYNIEAIPNDYYYNKEEYSKEFLWNFMGGNGINAEPAWDTTIGSDLVSVGILDSGIDASHPDLSNNISTAGLHRDFTVSPILTVLNTNLADPNGHGTHVAGIVGAKGNNLIGVTGVSWNVSLISLRVFDAAGHGNTGYVADAVDFAGSSNIPILNYSGGGYYYDSNLKTMISNYSGLFVCSAGNGQKDPITNTFIGVNTDTIPHYPSVYSDETNYNVFLSSRVISVGSIDSEGNRENYSNYGVNTVSLYAPGSNVLNTFPTSRCSDCEYVTTDSGLELKCECVYEYNKESSTWKWVKKSIHKDNNYHLMSGTSMAAPHVTGVAALLLSINPLLTAAELKTIIINNADDITIDKGEVKKLNAYNSVLYFSNIFTTTDLGNNTVRIDGLAADCSGSLIIPSVYKDKKVTQIKNYAFAFNQEISSVTIPNSVTLIGSNAFFNCVNLENVFFDAVRGTLQIDSYAFQQCLRLKSITIPSNVYINYGVFSFDENLTIYTNASSTGNLWSSYWNRADTVSIERPVVWGCALYENTYVWSVFKTDFNITKPNAINGISAPSREGYTFGGWYSDNTFTGAPIAAENIVLASNNIRYYAKWIPNRVVTIDYADGITEEYSFSVKDGYTIDKPLDYPTRDNYVFNYWALSTDLSHEYDWEMAITDNIIIKAVWQSVGNNNVVTFKLDEQSEDVYTQKMVADGLTVSIPAFPKKVGYNFLYWTLSGQTAAFSFNTPITSDIDLVAKWQTATTRTVTFDTNGGYDNYSTITLNQGEKVNEPDIEPVLEQHNFEYWALSTNLSQAYNWNSPVTQNITLKAVWSDSTRFVLFNTDGGTYSLWSLTVYPGDTVYEFTKYYSNPTKTGFTFRYWALTGSTTEYNLNTSISNDITLKAIWQINTYTVSFNTDGGNGLYPNVSVQYGSTVNRPSSDPSKSGYIFKYWALLGQTSEYNFSTPVISNITLVAIWEEKSCVAAGTMITLADGTQKQVELLTGNEILLVWNMYTGQFDFAPILFIDYDTWSLYSIINLYFSDGTIVRVIDEHAFWDFNLNEYVFLRQDAAQYIGHWFNKQTYDINNNMIWTCVQLTNVVITEEYTTAWSPVTYGHLCFYVNGMLSMPGATTGLINIFDVDGATMTINEMQYIADIANYGLFTYQEFTQIYDIPEIVFDAFNGQYLKVAIGKGLIDYYTLGCLIERYLVFFEDN